MPYFALIIMYSHFKIACYQRERECEGGREGEGERERGRE